MREVPLVVFAGLVALTAPAHAELPDCATFPDDRARFACYDAISRAPKPEPREAMKPDAGKPKPAAAHSSRKVTRENRRVFERKDSRGG
jgi:hypothetical protein